MKWIGRFQKYMRSQIKGEFYVLKFLRSKDPQEVWIVRSLVSQQLLCQCFVHLTCISSLDHLNSGLAKMHQIISNLCFSQFLSIILQFQFIITCNPLIKWRLATFKHDIKMPAREGFQVAQQMNYCLGTCSRRSIHSNVSDLQSNNFSFQWLFRMSQVRISAKVQSQNIQTF